MKRNTKREIKTNIDIVLQFQQKKFIGNHLAKKRAKIDYLCLTYISDIVIILKNPLSPQGQIHWPLPQTLSGSTEKKGQMQ